MKFLLMIFVGVFISSNVHAQTVTVSGHVGDSNTSEIAIMEFKNIATTLQEQIDQVSESLNHLKNCNKEGKFFNESSGGCVDEMDPTVRAFAKTDLPSCQDDEFLKSDGTGLFCAQTPTFETGHRYRVTCTSKAGRTQTVYGNGAGDALIARAPSNLSTWIIFKNGPYLNCFDPGAGPQPISANRHLYDFVGEQRCNEYAAKPGHGRYLAQCAWQ